MKSFLTGLAVLAGMAGYASASVSYTFSGDYTVFNGSSVAPTTTESFTSGSDTFQLSYNNLGGSNAVSSFPTNVNFGEFVLTCTAGCDGTVVDFPSFTFVITITDSTDGGTGTFTGTSSGGNVSDNGTTGTSNISIAWSPTQLGPGTGAWTGSFGTTFFTISTPTLIVDPTTNDGATTVQGTINSTATPEPLTFGLVGAGLAAIGLLRRKPKA